MIKILFATLALFSGALAFARGGMIGGGDVDFKPLMTCDAQGIDPTFPGSSYLQVVKEVDYNGQFLPDATLRIVSLNDKLDPVSFYVSHESELLLSPDNSLSLVLWQYDVGSPDNKKIGAFTWDESSNTGSLSSTEQTNEVEELQLSNCIHTP